MPFLQQGKGGTVFRLCRKQEAIKLLQREIKAYPGDTVTPKAKALLKQLQAGKAK
jgi:hypothetical protein